MVSHAGPFQGLSHWHFPLAKIRAYSGAGNQQRADNWQQLAITVKALVPSLGNTQCHEGVSICP
jgi:hypothetical protein